MAQRRMFSKTITNSSQFLMMPSSSQNLYFHLGMNADDDGFCEHFTIMRMTESKPDDLKILQAKSFINIFDDRVLVIIDWKENNYLRSDRYTPSKYLDIYKEELKFLTGTPLVYQMATQDRIGKDRIGKDRIEERGDESPTPKEATPMEVNKDFFLLGGTYQLLLSDFGEKIDQKILEHEFQKFIVYWTEPNKSGTKVRWEQQNTFDVKRRLFTWLSRIQDQEKRAVNRSRGLEQ